jgi:hypothetical protein
VDWLTLLIVVNVFDTAWGLFLLVWWLGWRRRNGRP